MAGLKPGLEGNLVESASGVDRPWVRVALSAGGVRW